MYTVYTMLTLQTSFKPLLLRAEVRGGGGALASFKNVYDATLLQHTQDLLDVT
jgi:hypothetical protein